VARQFGIGLLPLLYLKRASAAFAPLAADVADLFGKWSYVASLPFQPG
jgi:hypothetical protein